MFGRRRQEKASAGAIEVRMPVPGRVIPLVDVPDPVFSAGLAGDGVAVEPTAGIFTAPIGGTLTLVADTGHAFGVRTPDGLEILVHIGVDTVTLKGEGFTRLREAGERVCVGDPVIEVNLDAVAPRVPSLVSPVLVTNPDQFAVAGTTPSGALLVTAK